jgi:hypothetical protein
MARNRRLGSTTIALTLLTVVTISGCSGTAQTTKGAVSAPVAPSLAGKVVETMDSGGYTYILLDDHGVKTWVAAPVMKVSVGQELKLLPGGEMLDFWSQTLNRSFDRIIFSGGLDSRGVAAPAAAKLDAGAVKTAPDAKKAPAKEAEELVMTGKVTETMDAGNYTYLCLEQDGKRSWAAVPGTTISVGDEVELLPGTPMGEFTSKTLNRTFEAIYFAGGVKMLKAAYPAVPAKAAAAAKTAPAAAAKTAAKIPAAAAGKAGAAAQLPSGHPKIDAAAAATTPPALTGLPTGHPKIDAAAQTALDEAKAATPDAAAAAPAPAPLSGKVVETANAGGYTYICLEKDAKKTWVAVPSMEVKVGEEMALAPGMVMSNFVSKSLDRTFDKIVFSSGPLAN